MQLPLFREALFTFPFVLPSCDEVFFKLFETKFLHLMQGVHVSQIVQYAQYSVFMCEHVSFLFLLLATIFKSGWIVLVTRRLYLLSRALQSAVEGTGVECIVYLQCGCLHN